MTLFLEKGYPATSLKDLEAPLQMKPGGIHAAREPEDGEAYLPEISLRQTRRGSRSFRCGERFGNPIVSNGL